MEPVSHAPFRCRLCDHTESRALVERIRDWEYGCDGEYAYHECARCCGIQLHPFPELSVLIDAYNVPYHGYVESTGKGALYRTLWVVKEWLLQQQLKRFLSPTSRVLDIGCGSGEFLGQIKAACGVRHVEGIDFHDTAVRLATEKGVLAHRGIFLEFPGQKQSYD